MKARPILFSGAMIRALLSCRKTQTRRVVKPQPPEGTERWQRQLDGRWAPIIHGYVCGEYPVCTPTRCPHGQPGDLLWVRETWQWLDGGVELGDTDGIVYRADTPDAAESWRSSIHMPRWASRLTLELTDVRVEKVADISVEDARAEGCEHPLAGAELAATIAAQATYVADERTTFAILWNRIHGPGAWGRNDYVWVLSFRVIHANVNDVLANPRAYGLKVAA